MASSVSRSRWRDSNLRMYAGSRCSSLYSRSTCAICSCACGSSSKSSCSTRRFCRSLSTQRLHACFASAPSSARKSARQPSAQPTLDQLHALRHVQRHDLQIVLRQQVVFFVQRLLRFFHQAQLLRRRRLRLRRCVRALLGFFRCRVVWRWKTAYRCPRP